MTPARIENPTMPEHSRPGRRRRRRRSASSIAFAPARIAIGTGAISAGFALGMLLLTYGPATYASWREGQLLKRASAMLAQQDFDGATKTAREIVQKRPDSVAAF